MLKDQMLAG